MSDWLNLHICELKPLQLGQDIRFSGVGLKLLKSLSKKGHKLTQDLKVLWLGGTDNRSYGTDFRELGTDKHSNSAQHNYISWPWV